MVALSGNSGAVWSPTGKDVLLLYTFWPGQRYPCLAAVAAIASHRIACVAFSSGDYVSGAAGYLHHVFLQNGAFGQTDNDVVLTTRHAHETTYSDNYYHYQHGAWKLLRVIPSTSLHPEGQLSVEVREDMNTPPALWVTDRVTKAGKKLWDPNVRLVGMNLGKVSLLRWKDASGYTWSGGLLLPPNYVLGKRYPLVVQTHGFEPQVFLSDGPFPTAFAARPLANAGIIVLQMNQEDDHQRTTQELPDNIRGFESAIALLDAKGLIDPKRVGAIGFSRTGYYVEGAMIADPQLFAAASITDSTDGSYVQELLRGKEAPEGTYLNGAPPFGNGLEAWMKNAPGFHLDRVETPLLVGALGGDDGVLDIMLEWELYASLRMQNKPVDLMYIPDGHHVLQKPLERLASQQTNVDWFRFWLQGYEDPDPVKRVQYKRWEGLRKLQEAEERHG
jgi:dipeptidyl aminopeptidase/acylaminoacyl peptidase